MHSSARVAAFVTVLVMAAWSASVSAQPPPHAPAHGWRAKQAARYPGRTGVQWEHDYEILSGRCNREAIGTVVGGVVGGAIANRVGDEHRAVATIIGAAAGALIGRRIGRELDERDRSCLGHALDIGTAGTLVTWANESTGVQYRLVPGADRHRDGVLCREFTLTAEVRRERSSRSGLACRSQPGVWEVVR